MFEDTAHAFVGRAEERARHGAGIAGGLNEGVAADFDVVTQVTVVPDRARPGRARRCIGRPLFEPRELDRARQRRQVDGEIGGAGDSLGVRREAEQTAGPGDAARECGVIL